uniref:Acetyltransferase (Isoleucine patch superfamily)-like protein n=2 Tax=unclassified Mycobacterium TaxID=2642494 RepID=A0A5Q5BFZ6_MYCSS
MLKSHQPGPFRAYPWPLERLRSMIRYLRLQRVNKLGSAKLSYGKSISFARGADVRPPRFIELGHHISFGKNFTCEVDTRIGNNVLISSNVSFIGRDHPFDDSSVTVYEVPRVDDSLVEIGSDVLIGFGTIVIGTTKIGDGCIVGAGSVVVRDLPPYTVCAGVPAKPIKARFPDKTQPGGTS